MIIPLSQRVSDKQTLETLSVYTRSLVADWTVAHDFTVLDGIRPGYPLGCGLPTARMPAGLRAHTSHQLLVFKSATELPIRNLSKAYANSLHALKDVMLRIPAACSGYPARTGPANSR